MTEEDAETPDRREREEREEREEHDAHGPHDDEARELDEQIGSYLRMGLPLATLGCAVVAGLLQGAAAVVLVLAAFALVSVIAIFWTSIRTLVGETALSGADAYALGAPRAEEEQKRAVLRALKDLEFERSVGKLSDADYAALVAKYRAEAKRLIRVLDEDAVPRRKKVESLVDDRLVREGLREAPEIKPAKATKQKARQIKPSPAAKAEARAEAEPEASDDARPACTACGTRNDPDAVFCKKCGQRRASAAIEAEQDEARE
jgi:ribosomal protein L40E